MNTTHDSSNNKIVHESLDERQYVRVKIPAKVMLSTDGVEPFESDIFNISLGGMGLKCEKQLPIGALLVASVKLRLDAIDLNIDTRVKVVSQHNDEVGVQFIDLGPQKQDIIRYIISAYMSGEIADINGLFNVMQRENYIKERKKSHSYRRSMGERIVAVLGTLIFTLIGLSALGFVAYRVYILYLRVPVASAVVSADTYMLAMPENGNLNYLIKSGQTSVRLGEPIATISTQLATRFSTTGDIAALSNLSIDDVKLLLDRTTIETVINSPCDGDLYFSIPPMNGFFYKDNLLAEVIPKDTEFFVRINVPYEKMNNTNRIKSIMLTVDGDERPMKGEVVDVVVNERERLVVLRVRPERSLSINYYRKPVAVELFLTLPFSL